MTIIRFSIDTGAGNQATPIIPAYCQPQIHKLDAGNISYPSNYDPLFLICLGQNLADFNRSDCQSFANSLDRGIDSLRNDRGSYQSLPLNQQSLRLPALEFLVLLRDICRAHPLCTVFFYP
jgi:hypothetical protein